MVSPVRGLRPLRAARCLTPERTKTDHGHLLPFLQRRRHAIDDGVYGTTSICFREIGCTRYRIDQFCFVISIPYARAQFKERYSKTRECTSTREVGLESWLRPETRESYTKADFRVSTERAGISAAELLHLIHRRRH